MNIIPEFPEFASVSASMYKELYPFLNNLPDGVSEFTFLNLYLYRAKYDYRISRLPQTAETTFIVNGRDKYGTFFFVIGDLPSNEQIEALLCRKTGIMKIIYIRDKALPIWQAKRCTKNAIWQTDLKTHINGMCGP